MYLICGYPPFLKQLVDSDEIDLSGYDVVAAVGGEGISESLRGYLLRSFKAVYSSFGAADLEINIAAENDFTIGVRRLLRDRPEIGEALGLPGHALPMVFQYNPLDYYIETTESDELLFSICRLDSLSPKLRYNLHDSGCVVRFPELTRVLAGLRHRARRPRRALPRPAAALPLRALRTRPSRSTARRSPPRTSRRRCSPSRELQELVTSFVLIVGEDAEANKTLRLAFELADGRQAPKRSSRSAPRCSTRSSPSTRTTARRAASSRRASRLPSSTRQAPAHSPGTTSD